jgi:hypothetical protein
MNPTARDVHVDVALTNVSIKYTNDNYIADKVAPIIPTGKDSNLFFVYGKQNLSTYKTDRAIGTRAHKIEHKVSATGNYFTIEHALEQDIPDEIRDNADEPLDMDADTTENITEALKIDKEIAVGGSGGFAQTDANFGTAAAPSGAKWDQATGTTIVKQIQAGTKTIQKAIAKHANTMVVSNGVDDAFSQSPELQEYYKYTKGGLLDESVFTKIFKVAKYLVADAITQTAAEGQTETTDYIWADDVILAYVEPSPGIKKVSWLYQFQRKGFPLVKKWRDETVDVDTIKVADKYDIKLIDKYAAIRFKSVLSA